MHSVQLPLRRHLDWLVNMNHPIVTGLRRQGCGAEADRLARSTIAMVEQWRRRYGVVFEFYDSVLHQQAS